MYVMMFQKKQDSIFTSVTPCQSYSQLHDFKYSAFCDAQLRVMMSVEVLMLLDDLCLYLFLKCLLNN